MILSLLFLLWSSSLQWCHNESYGISDYRRLDRLLSHLLRRKSKNHQSTSALAFEREVPRWIPLTKGQ